MLKSILVEAEHGATSDALVAARADTFPADAVTAAVQALVNIKVLVRHDNRGRGDATLDHLAHRREQAALIQPDQHAAYAPGNWSLLLAGAGACADAMAASLNQLGVAVERLAADAALPATGTRRALLLVCADSEDFGLFRAMNAKAIEQALPALFLGVDWSTVQCGPLVLPKATACYECYFQRVRTTRKFVAEFDVRSNARNLLWRAVPSRLAIQFGVAEASRLVLQYLSGTLEGIQHSVFSEIDSLTGEIARSRVLRLPRCQSCGAANTARPVGSVFQQALLRRTA